MNRFRLKGCHRIGDPKWDDELDHIHSTRSISEARVIFAEIAAHLELTFNVSIAWPYTPAVTREEVDREVDIQLARVVTIQALFLIRTLESGDLRKAIKQALEYGDENRRLHQAYLRRIFKPGNKARRANVAKADKRRRMVAEDFIQDRELSPTRKREALERDLAEQYGVTDRTIRKDIAIGKSNGTIPVDL